MRLRNIAMFSAVMLAAAIAGSPVGPRPAKPSRANSSNYSETSPPCFKDRKISPRK